MIPAASSIEGIYAAVPGAVVVARPDGSIVHLSGEARSLLGGTGNGNGAGERPLTDLLPGVTFPQSEDGSFEISRRRQDGSSVRARVRSRRLELEDGEFGLFLIDDSGPDSTAVGEVQSIVDRMAEAERVTGRGSWVWDIRANTVTWTDQLFRVFGFEPGAVEPSYERYLNRIHPDDRKSVAERIGKALRDGASWTDRKRAIKADGSEFILATQGGVVVDESGEPLQMYGICGDVTEEVTAERASAQLDALVESSHDAIVVQDLEGRITAWSPGAARVFGYSADEVVGRLPEEFQDWDDYRDTKLVIDRILAGESNGTLHEGMRTRSDGTRFRASTITSPVSDVDGRLSGTACIIRDVSEREQGDGENLDEGNDGHAAGLVDRESFMQRLDALVGRTSGTLLRFDLDNFRLVNERYGHRNGDLLLRSLARAIRSGISSADEMCRFGGDEFALFIVGADREGGAGVARDLLERIRGLVVPIDGVPVTTTASIGVACLASPGERSADELMTVADRARLTAKTHGKDRYVVSRGDEAVHDPGQFEWGVKLRDALADDLLELHLQPIVSVADRSVVMHEVLVRMRDGDELVLPERFLAAAEQQGSIHELDRTVVRKSLDLLERHESLRLSVNLSGKSLDDELLLEMLRSRLAVSPIDPGSLVFEVTETSAIVDVEAARRFSVEVQDLGCHLALDDFGTGFGSFSYLKRIHAQYLKIDGEFISPPRSEIDEVVIDAVVSVARSLGKTTVAEHVEDEESFEMVSRSGVDLAQGNLFGLPAPVADVIRP
ncbi:MAG: putative bifunctional diguanylate cyclase/phosphodiesterase [Solirubrobacterales bacterium]